MKKGLSIFILIFATGILPACHKTVEEGKFPLIGLLDSHLTDGPWRFISATTIYANGTQSRYAGGPLDSVIFQYGIIGNGDATYPSNVVSYINEINSTRKWDHIFGYTLTISPSWRNGLSDTVECTSISDFLMVFKIKTAGTANEAYEIDSLKKIRFWNP